MDRFAEAEAHAPPEPIEFERGQLAERTSQSKEPGEARSAVSTAGYVSAGAGLHHRDPTEPIARSPAERTMSISREEIPG